MPGQQFGHRARQHSQGFFEPSLTHATANTAGLSASQIAAQAAMHHVSPPPNPSQERKRSYPGLAPINTVGAQAGRMPSGRQSPSIITTSGLPYCNGTLGGNLASAMAANAAFPNGRSPLPSPNPIARPVPGEPMGPPPDKEPKTKSSKMKLFSKPKNITLSKEKDARVGPAMPSPGKGAISAGLLRGGFANASTTSLLETTMSSASSIYSSANASTSTLVPIASEKEKRHHFLSRQKLKKDDPSTLPLSSAHSNSQATNPDKPAPLYSFTPESPGPGSFAKSMSGFDLRHGGRALREKKKEEKAAAAAAKLDLTPIMSHSSVPGLSEQYLGPSQNDTSLGPSSLTQASVFAFPSDTSVNAQAFSNIGAQMGLPGLGPDDAWPLLKARLLNLFSGEDLRTPVEDFNMLLNVHIRRCIQRKSPIVLIEDVRELLRTGFTSLSQTLRGVPDDRLVQKLVEMWIGVYGSILPFLQAVFLPLDLEFKGRGVIMSVREAQDFWGAIPEALRSDDRPSSSGNTTRTATLGEELDIRRITLISFRDTVILPNHESLIAIFSRLSLDSINAAPSPLMPNESDGRKHAGSDPARTGAERPGTAGSLSPHMSSFNSQASTLLDAASTSSGGAHSLVSRSRATSNTSAGSFGTSMPHLNSPLAAPGSFSATTPLAPPVIFNDPSKVTETVARMLQCLYVVTSCQTCDVGQGAVERLTQALKHNWLGRGRTGRDRRGWVGTKHPPGARVGLVGA
ncbi:HbrB-like protein [Teratosphaeria nubilosa]|uniref:HbrB-like protein n=1 Tax=Teratosphaeria nubilosa TaxID=161662 RepID=A0A6G1KT51_9PEZI|nr:HbrB-like protein [Teratosphaeria nubilosa]